MSESIDTTTEKINQIICYKCGSKHSLLIEEKINPRTGKIAEKNFICYKCVRNNKNE